jgi:type VI secretion system protein ImpL
MILTSSAFPWLIVLIVIGAIVCVVIAVIVLRASRARVPMIPLSAAPAELITQFTASATDAGSAAAALGLKQSFTEATRALKSQTTGAADRLAIPWVLSIGESGAGKSTVIDSLRLARLPGLGRPADPTAHAPCTWNFFEHGIVLDIGGSLVLDPSRTHTDDRSWHTLIGQLQKHRPERPLDSVVLSIPSTDLVGPTRLSKDALAAKATRIGDRIAELQHSLSLRLPVYVLVTKCDRIPGFVPFCRAVPGRRLDDMLGWSSPYSVDAAFSPAWVDEAFDAVLAGVSEAEFAALAREDVPSDGGDLLLMPLHMGRARSPMREFMRLVFRTTAYERGAFLRGIFFSGDRHGVLERDEESMPQIYEAASTSAAPRVSTAMNAWLAEDEPPAPAPVVAEGRQTAFVGDLFSEKIFAERGLAQPGPRVFPSRNRKVAWMQMATAAIILLGPLAMFAAVNGVRIGPWRASRGVRAEEASIRPLLQNIDVAVRQMHSRRTLYKAASNNAAPDVSVFQLLDNMASLSTNHMWSVYLPGSLLSPLHHDITDAIGLSFQVIILPEFRERLAYRERRLFDPAVPLIRGDEHYAVNLSLPQYLVEVDALGRNIARFNVMSSLGNGDLQDLITVVQYLYGEEVAPGFAQDAGYYAHALSGAQTPAIREDPAQNARAVRRASELTRTSYLALLERLSGSAIGGDSADMARASRADISALVGLRAFLDTAGPVEHALSSIKPPFFFGNDFPVRVRDSVAFYKQQLTGQLLPRYADASHSADSETHALDALLRQQFMQAPTGRVIDATPRSALDLSWDVARLDDALALQADFDKFMAHGLDALPETLRNRVRRLATVQLASAMTDAIAGAAKVRASSMLTDGDRDLAAAIATFDQSAGRISHLLDLLDAMGATATYDALSDLSSTNAKALLARVDASLDLNNRYRLSPSSVNSWNGRAPFSAAAFGGRPGALDDFLSGEADAFRSAAQLARPMIAFLEAHSGDGSRRPANLRTWDAIISAVEKLDHKPSGGPLVAIESMLRTEVDSIDAKNCARSVPRPVAGADILTQRADAMWSAVWRRCVDVANRELATSYTHLETEFRNRLAGRFPFSAPEATTDAAPADVIDVLRGYDAFMAIARQTNPGDGPITGIGARTSTFLGDMAKVRVFLASLIDSAGTGRGPTLDYQVDFRVNRPREFGANQIAEWTADIADQHAVLGAPVAARRGRWRAGDDVRIALRWATGSQYSPIDPLPTGASLVDGTLVVSAVGEWSLLRLLKQHESDVPDPDGGFTVKIAVRTAQRGAPTSTARGFVRFRLFNPDSKADLAVPHFPISAPAFGEGR